MSSGHQISDNRHYVATRGQLLPEGEYFEKSWQGADLTDEERLLSYKPEHQYHCTILSQWTKLGMCTDWTTQGDNFLWTPRSWDNVDLVDPWSSNDDLKLWNKLGKKARDSEFNGGNFLAEFHQVPKLIADIAHKTAYALHMIRNGDTSSLKKYFKKNNKSQLSEVQTVTDKLASFKYSDAGANTSKKMAEGLLMYDYGISPLISDAEDAMAPLAQTLNTLQYNTRSKVQRILRTNGVTPSTVSVWNQSIMHRVQFRGRLRSRPTWRTLWHLNDPISAGLEATPWSFAVDWVIPISGYFGALDTLRSFEWESIWKTTFYEHSKIWSHLLPTAPRQGASFVGAEATDKFIVMDREMIDTGSIAVLPTPSIRPAKEVFSVKHMLDAAALAIGVKSNIAKSLKF